METIQLNLTAEVGGEKINQGDTVKAGEIITYTATLTNKGNTEVIAEYIRDIVGADMFKVEPLIPYSADYKQCIEESKVRTRSHDAPIKENVPDISSYDVIYVGAPVYLGGMPEELFTALQGLDYTGKIIRPFVTHEGSGLSGIPMQLRKLCEGATITSGIAIRGGTVNSARGQVEEWI